MAKYSPPTGADRRRGFVFCYPCGKEYFNAYSACRSLSQRLAARGFHVLRFDYPGTGDSSGEAWDFSAESWFVAVDQAVEELRAMAHIRDVGLAGLRCGALVALCAALGGRDLSSLLLWDPSEPGERDRGWVPHDLQDTLSSRAGSRWSELPDTLLLRTDRVPGGEEAERLRTVAESLTLEHRAADPVWDEDLGVGARPLPVDAFDAVLSWAGA